MQTRYVQYPSSVRPGFTPHPSRSASHLLPQGEKEDSEGPRHRFAPRHLTARGMGRGRSGGRGARLEKGLPFRLRVTLRAGGLSGSPAAGGRCRALPSAPPAGRERRRRPPGPVRVSPSTLAGDHLVVIPLGFVGRGPTARAAGARCLRPESPRHARRATVAIRPVRQTPLRPLPPPHRNAGRAHLPRDGTGRGWGRPGPGRADRGE